MWMDPSQNNPSAFNTGLGGGLSAPWQNAPSSLPGAGVGGGLSAPVQPSPFGGLTAPASNPGLSAPWASSGGVSAPVQPLPAAPANGGWQTNVMSNPNAGQPARGAQPQTQSPFGNPASVLNGMRQGLQRPITQFNPAAFQQPQAIPGQPVTPMNNNAAMARALLARGGA